MNILAVHAPGAELKRLSFKDAPAVRVAFSSHLIPGPWDLILQWGQPEAPAFSAVPVVNPSEALRIAADPERAKAILKAHRIPTAYYGHASRFKARYRLHVFDLRVLMATRRVKGRFKPVRTVGKRMERVREVALRSVYYLGLHFAAVDVAVIGRRAVPLAVDPAPELTKKLGQLYGKAAAAYLQRRLRRLVPDRPPVLLGADPEFIMKRKNGRVIYASRFFKKRGRVGYDHQGSRRHRGRGLRPIAELRPEPSENPIELVARIKALLRRAGKRAPRKGVRWEAGSLPVKGYPVGGHIHFSRIDLTTEFMRALDQYLAIPVMMLETPEKARRRRKKYGYLGEFRWQRYGGYEYRVLSSWIVAPHFALAVLSLAKLIADNYEKLNRNVLLNPDYCRMFYTCDKEGLREVFELLWSDLEALDDYKSVERYVEVIPRLVRENKRWLESQDLRPRWGLVGKPRRSARRKAREKH